jgi:hypothetical protein
MEKKFQKKCLLGVLIIFCITGLFAQPPDTLWTKTYGGVQNDEGFAVQQTSDDGYIIVGYTESYGAGGRDVYLIKTNANGYINWTKTYGGANDEWGCSVQQTSDGGYIIVGLTSSFGAGSGDVYLIKTNANGDTLWTETFGGEYYDIGNSVKQTRDGGYIIVGYTGVPPSRNVYLIKTNPNGSMQWSRTFQVGYADDVGCSIQQTPDGGYVIAGYTGWTYLNHDVYLVKTDSLGYVNWSNTYGGSDDDESFSLQLTSGGGYIIVGFTKSFGAGAEDVYLIKTNSNGDTLWTRTYGGTGKDIGFSVQQTLDGGYIIAGETWSFGAGEDDFYLIKTNSNGETLWTKTYGGLGKDSAFSVQQTSDQGYILTGTTRCFGPGNASVWLIKTAPDICIEETEPSRKDNFNSWIEPNPFFDKTSIKYNLSNSSNVQIMIYNLTGKEIRTLVKDKQNAGKNAVTWDGKDNSNKKVPNGIYFARLLAGDKCINLRLIKIR